MREKNNESAQRQDHHAPEYDEKDRKGFQGAQTHRIGGMDDVLGK